MELRESAENYLETIYFLIEKKGACRAIDVCRDLGVSKPTVSVALRTLRENGFLETDPEGSLTLTPAGAAVAARMGERHRVLTRMLTLLGVPEPIAQKDACKIEHDLSEETFACLKRHFAAEKE